MASLSELRSKVAEINAKLVSGELTQKGGGNRQEDPRLWYPKTDDKRMGYAVIRFLPSSPGANTPWVSMYSHRFKAPNGRWFIENCPTTTGGKCPVCEANSVAWRTETEEGKRLARERKRKITYWYNILVLKDPATPENEGQIKIFRSGSKIFEMVQGAMTPEFPGEQPLDPFDPWLGAAFELKIREYEGNTNYDKSEFQKNKAGPIGKDEEIEKVWNAQHDLSEFSNPNSYKSYEELEKDFNDKVGNTQTSASNNAPTAPAKSVGNSAPAPREAAVASAPVEADDDPAAFFKAFAVED